MEMKESMILSPRDDSQGQIIAILSSETPRGRKERGGRRKAGNKAAREENEGWSAR
jgi:hypothetical protein